jgi:hypothetical protein
MLIKVFKENQGFTFLFLLLLSAVLWALVVFRKTIEPGVLSLYDHSIFFLFPSLKNINQNFSLSIVLNILLILISGYYLSRIVIKYQLIPGRSILPMLTFFFLSLPWFSTYRGFSYALFTLPVLLYITDILFRSAEEKRLSFAYFNAAMIISVASLFNFFIAFYLLFIFFLFFRLRGGLWREVLFIILGAILPYVVFFAMLYLFDADIQSFLSSYIILNTYHFVFEATNPEILLLLFLGIFFFVASWKAMNQYVKMKIIVRKYSVLLLVLFALSIILGLLFQSINRDIMLFIAVPLSFLFGFYFTTCRTNIFNQILFLLFMAGNASVFVLSIL